MKKRLLILTMLMAALFVLPGCNDESASSADGNSAEEINISVTPPEGWEPVEGSVAPVHYLKGTAGLIVKSESFTGETIDAVTEEAKAVFESAFDNVQYVGDTESLNVDGKDARKLIFTCDVSGMNMKYEYVYLFAGNDVYAITFGDLTENFDSMTADFETILGNISFR